MLNFLGKGSCFNTQEGNNSAFIKERDKLILFDCGPSILAEMKSRENFFDDINEIYIFITHMHNDHVGSLSCFIWYAKFVLNIIPIIHFPYSLKSVMTASSKRVLVDDLTLHLELLGNKEFRDYKRIKIKSGMFTNIGSVMIAPRLTTHMFGESSYGYEIFFKDKKVYFSGDTNEFDKKWLDKYDEIYQDVALVNYENNPHLSFKDLKAIVPKESRGKVILMHLENKTIEEEAVKEGFRVVDDEMLGKIKQSLGNQAKSIYIPVINEAKWYDKLLFWK